MRLIAIILNVVGSAALAAVGFGLLHRGAGMPPGWAALVSGVAAWEFGRTMLRRIA
jgi:hypothetical protein